MLTRRRGEGGGGRGGGEKAERLSVGVIFGRKFGMIIYILEMWAFKFQILR